MSTSAGKALEPTLFTLKHQLDINTGRDMIYVRSNYEIPKALASKTFSAASAWTNKFNDNNPEIRAACVRVNDEIQIATVVGERFSSAAMISLRDAVLAAAPTSPGPGDDTDAIGKQVGIEDDEEEKPSDDDPQPLSV